MSDPMRYSFREDERVAPRWGVSDPRSVEALTRDASGRDASGSVETDRLVVLTGFMGTGKTAAGRRLARMLGRPFLDMDEEIAGRAGHSVAEIFAQRGEAAFRALETELCRELAKGGEAVIATGGGTLLDAGNRDLLRQAGRVFVLQASADSIAQRVREDTARPLLLDRDGRPLEGAARSARTGELLEARRIAYAEAGETVETGTLDPGRVAARIAARLPLMHRTITTELPPGGRVPAREQSLVEIGRGIALHLGHRLRAHGLDGPVFLMIAERLVPLYQDLLDVAFEEARLTWHAIPVADGDGEKTFAQVERILGRLADSGATRDATAVTFGGGVTGDMGGFAASIYMRGMPLVQVPTTLLGQVDASIGGKMGVNHPRAKNLVGSFHQPHLVVIDPCLLGTLPRREVSCGMAEVIKTAILGSAELFGDLVATCRSVPEGSTTDPPADALADPAAGVEATPVVDPLSDPLFLERCVMTSAFIKSTVVQRDPFERGERKVLNLGHTAGHAFEAISGYGDLRHGEAVAIGLVIAGHIAVGRGLWPPDRLEQTVHLLRACGLPVVAPRFDPKVFLQSLHLDKKKRAGRLRYVLPLEVGTCEVVEDVTDREILRAAEATREWKGA